MRNNSENNVKGHIQDNLKIQNQILLQKKRRATKKRFIRFVIILVFFLVFLVFAFNFIQNPSFFSDILTTFKSFYSSDSKTSVSGESSISNSETLSLNSIEGKNKEASNDLINSNNSNKANISNTSNASGTSGTSDTSVTSDTSDTSVTSDTSDTSDALSSSSQGLATEASKNPIKNFFSNNPLFQKIFAFLKIGMEKEAKNFPSKLEIKVYFASLGNEEKFSYEKRTIIAGDPETALKSAIKELLKGPLKSFNYPVIPPKTKLLSVEIYENFAKINFSKEFLENSLESSILDEYVIYTIVNTVTQIPGVDGVIFFIDGKRIKLYGTVDLSIPAIREEKYLDKEN